MLKTLTPWLIQGFNIGVQVYHYYPSCRCFTIHKAYQSVYQWMFCPVQKIRAVVRDIEQSTRAIHTAIQAAHHCAVKDSMS